MDDALLVRRGKPLRDLHAVLEGSSYRESAGEKPHTQRLALEQLHHRVGRLVLPSDVV